VAALLFPRSPLEPTAPRRPRDVTKQFGRLASGVGFGGFRLHDLRHTHATLLLLAGVPINAVASRLGHSSPVTTMTVYAHVLRRAEDRAAEVAGGLLRAALAD
jgi:integrase